MAVSIEDIIKKEFSRSLMGYDMQEVDVFLDTIIDRIEKMEVEREELVTAMEKLLRRVERMEKAAESEKRALDSGEKQARKLTNAGGGPVHVQGTKPHAETTVPEKTNAPRTAKAQQSAQKRSGETVHTDAPAYSKPIRPAAQTATAVPQMPEQATAVAEPANMPEPKAADGLPNDLPAPRATQSVAIEMETGAYAPDAKEIIPELLEDIESVLFDGNIRSASHQDTPVRATDKTRVS